MADPPWPVELRYGTGGRRARPTAASYSTMPLEAIEGLPVTELAAPDAHLFLWVPASLNREGIGSRVARAWRFRVASELIWEKPNLGTGAFPRPCHEVLLICSRGSLPWTGPRNVRSVQRWPQPYAVQNGYIGKTHSAKPSAAYDLIEQQSPAPRVELFARQPRLGWDSWGWGYEQAVP